MRVLAVCSVFCMRRKLVVNYVDDQNSACVIDSRREGKSEGSADCHLVN